MSLKSSFKTDREDALKSSFTPALPVRPGYLKKKLIS